MIKINRSYWTLIRFWSAFSLRTFKSYFSITTIERASIVMKQSSCSFVSDWNRRVIRDTLLSVISSWLCFQLCTSVEILEKSFNYLEDYILGERVFSYNLLFCSSALYFALSFSFPFSFLFLSRFRLILSILSLPSPANEFQKQKKKVKENLFFILSTEMISSSWIRLCYLYGKLRIAIRD